MTLLWLMPVIVSMLMLAAHFSRADNTLLMVLSLILILLLFIKKQWVAWLFRIVLILGSMEWIRRAWVLIDIRAEAGEPYLRMAVILGVLSLFTLLSAFVFHSRRLRSRYFDKY